MAGKLGLGALYNIRTGALYGSYIQFDELSESQGGEETPKTLEGMVGSSQLSR
jgi:hypothetical protein